MPSGRWREHAQYVTSLKIHFRPRLTAVASRILKSLIFTIALASICINQVHFPHTLDILAQSFELKGMVRCASHHFTKAINNRTEWIGIDGVCVCVSQKFHFNSGSLE